MAHQEAHAHDVVVEDPSLAEKYAEATLAELLRAEALLAEAVETASEPELRWRFDGGFAEYLGPGTSLEISDHDPLEISSYIFLPRGEGIYKVVLPPEEFPALHEQKAELVWLRHTLQERQYLAQAGR